MDGFEIEDWCHYHWGSKWNAFSCDQEDHKTFNFSTAWQGVLEIIIKISERYPDVEIEYEFADENVGYNCVQYVIKWGRIIHVFVPIEGSVDAYELSFKFWPEKKECFELKDGEYIGILG